MQCVQVHSFDESEHSEEVFLCISGEQELEALLLLEGVIERNIRHTDVLKAVALDALRTAVRKMKRMTSRKLLGGRARFSGLCDCLLREDSME